MGIFPTEAETVHNAAYLPKSRYTLREWTEEGNFRTFAPSTNRHTHLRITTVKTTIEALAVLVREYIAANCDRVDNGFEVMRDGYMVFVEYRAESYGGSVAVINVWDKYGNECLDIAEAVQLLAE